MNGSIDDVVMMSLFFFFPTSQTSEGKALKDFKTTRHEDDVKTALRDFISENPSVKVSSLAIYERATFGHSGPKF